MLDPIDGKIALAAGLTGGATTLLHNHYGPGPGKKKIGRWLAYIQGLAPILAAFTLLQIARDGRRAARAIADILLITLAAAVAPTLGRIALHRRTRRQIIAVQQARTRAAL